MAVVALGLTGAGVAQVIALDGTQCKCGPPERSAWVVLRAVITAQSAFRDGDKEGDGLLDHATSFAELGAAGLVDSETARGAHAGYRFEIVRATEWEWAARATPAKARDAINLRLKGPFMAFYVDQRGLIRGRPSPDGETAGPDDPLAPEPR